MIITSFRNHRFGSDFLPGPFISAGFILTIVSIFLTFVSCTGKTNPPAPFGPVPTPRQLSWHRMEMNAFIHFGPNTFTGREWGYGDDPASVFDPDSLDARQWVRVLKEAGFGGVILTCKHHDGFCLWPGRFTEYSVKNSPFRNGDGDVVGEVRDACSEAGLKFGIYLSPWDRNRTDYGMSSYITYYRNQLKELFSSYGPIFEMWFDGANGGDGYYGGANEVRHIDAASYYDWSGTITMVRSLQPGVIFFSDAGPDVRWCGNERGSAGKTNWNTISTDTLYAGKPGISKLLNRGSEDGDRWVPAEVDVSIRPGWFYHPEEDTLVKSAEELFDIYLNSVGRGANLLLNVPPDRRGLIHREDIEALRQWRRKLDRAFVTDLAAGKAVSASSYRGHDARYSPGNLTDGNPDTYWACDDGFTTGSIEIDLGEPDTVKYAMIREYIRLGQRIRSFSVEILQNGDWIPAARGTTIGYKRILRLLPAEASKIRINILDSRACPVISTISVY